MHSKVIDELLSSKWPNWMLTLTVRPLYATHFLMTSTRLLLFFRFAQVNVDLINRLSKKRASSLCVVPHVWLNVLKLHQLKSTSWRNSSEEYEDYGEVEAVTSIVIVQCYNSNCWHSHRSQTSDSIISSNWSFTLNISSTGSLSSQLHSLLHQLVLPRREEAEDIYLSFIQCLSPVL